jgi:Leucine-rich repeat (LRR) protein
VTGDLFPEDIGSGIGSLMNLERLNVGGILFALPEKWEELKNLKMLDVANARVTQLPEWIGALTLNKLRLNRRLENSPSLRFVNQGTNVLFG